MEKIKKTRKLKKFLEDHGITELFEKEVRRQNNGISPRPYASLDGAFVFSRTEEGFEFWDEKHELFEKNL